MDLDPALADSLKIVGAAVAGALSGGLVSAWNTRRAEERALARELAAEKRADERDAKRLRRDHLLRQVEHTEGDYLGTMDWLLAWLLGDKEGLTKARHGDKHYPDAQWYLIYPEELLAQVLALKEELMQRPFGSRPTDHDIARLGAQQGHVLARLGVQRERIMKGEEPHWPSLKFIEAIVSRKEGRFAAPADYQPQMKQE